MRFHATMDMENSAPILSKITCTPRSGVLLLPMMRRLTVYSAVIVRMPASSLGP